MRVIAGLLAAAAVASATQTAGNRESRVPKAKSMIKRRADTLESLLKRDTTCEPVDADSFTCAKSCGTGFETCVSIPNCYDPTAGESCCSDGTYCPDGYYCTEFVCCPSEMSLEECGAEENTNVPGGGNTTDDEDDTPSTTSTFDLGTSTSSTRSSSTTNSDATTTTSSSSSSSSQTNNSRPSDGGNDTDDDDIRTTIAVDGTPVVTLNLGETPTVAIRTTISVDGTPIATIDLGAGARPTAAAMLAGLVGVAAVLV